MNRIQLIGRIGRDPAGGQNAKGGFATFSLATHEFWTDRASGERGEHTEWHQLVCYDRLAEIALEFLSKGSEIYVEGRVRSTRWTDKEGKELRATEIRIDELRMLRRAPTTDPVIVAAKSMAAVEKLMRDAAGNLRSDVSMADLADMLNTIRTGLVGEDHATKAADDVTA